MVDRRPLLALALGLACCLGPAAVPAADAPRADGVQPASAPLEESSPVCPRAAIEGGARDVPSPRIVELYPNPTVPDNEGEYLALEVPPDTRLGEYVLTDGHTTARLPNRTVSGRVTATTAPNVTATLTDDPLVELEGTLRLAVDGDEIELRRDGTDDAEPVDRVSYDRAPFAERWYRSDGPGSDAESGRPAEGTWWPRDGTCLPAATADVEEATTFVLPDAPALPLETIREADDRLLLAGYTVTDPDVVDALLAAADRGVDVSVLLEASPVGGTPAATEPALEALLAGDVDVRAVGGEGARYRFHHPKYAVADDRLLVTTENWKPDGVGGESSRGWGVRLEDPRLADELAAVFRADAGGWDAVGGETYLRETSFVEPDEEEGGSISPATRGPETVPIESAELLVAPDNAEPRLRELIAGAEEEILVKQVSVDADVSLLEETLEAARRGVEVRILLDATWYVAEENAALVEELERTASEEGLSLEAKLVGDTDRFEKIHAKGIVIDGETAVVGSANWNENALRNNREAMLALYGSAAAEYYAAVFEDDWSAGDGRWELPLEFGATVVVALVLAAVVGRRYVRFGSE